LEKQCGQGIPVRDTNGRISEIKWSDGRREISLAGTMITYRDIALGKAAAEENERSEQEAVRRLRQPITGAFGYGLGEKLRSGLPIDPEDLYYIDNSANFPSFKYVVVNCLHDRRICSIIGEIGFGQFDVVKNLFEKTYGLGRPFLGDGEMWSDRKHEINLTPRLIICSDKALYAQWRKESEEQKAIYKLRKPITGAFGYTLGEKLPEGLFIDPESHSYSLLFSDSMTKDISSFFPISLECLNDRRICMIIGTVTPDQIPVVRPALEKKYGTGRFEDNGTETWGDGKRTIALKPPIIFYASSAEFVCKFPRLRELS